VPDAARAREDVTVHARSVYLQGILAPTTRRSGPSAGVDAEGTLYMLDTLASSMAASRSRSLPRYARGRTGIDGVVIGMETEISSTATWRCSRPIR
jgi:hypothetical protein